ncbi:MAG: glucokinase [Polyangiaceae bacterium]
MILAGDIGGTNARLALYDDGGKKVIALATVPTHAHKNLESAISVFFGKKKPTLTASTFAVAGPIVHQRCKMSNLDWVIDGRRLAKTLDLPRVTLINDLVALAYGALGVPRRKLVPLSKGSPPKTSGATVAVIAAGTGLGEAVLVWDGRHVPCASEGGHTDFAPRNKLEIELLEFLVKRVGGRVSYERILSGPGIGNLYDFFRQKKRVAESAANTNEIESAADRNATISGLGASGKSHAAVQAVELFCSLYGAEAGNLALKSFATGGVFVAGKIAGHLAPTLKKGHFMRSFLDKGRMSTVLAKVPVAIVLDSDIGLAGSARHAASVRDKTET